ncbi:MAG: hypothetical protein M1546_09805 [Chloroflexi bacterium]|nr:hypothetical protein [Chloroflexota bacterium]
MSQAIERSACAKIILCGEHAVVYGRPAIALPLPHLRAHARIVPGDGPFRVIAPDIRAEFDLTTDASRPLAHLVRSTFEFLQQPVAQATLTVTSQIPTSSHLGSSAAVAVAVTRAVSAYCGHELSPAETSALAFEAEKIYHGSPSGIDNTVIAYEQPVWFVRRKESREAVRSPNSEVKGRRAENAAMEQPQPPSFNEPPASSRPLGSRSAMYGAGGRKSRRAMSACSTRSPKW